jgi:hypothetical protein
MTVIIHQITAVLDMPDDYLQKGQHAEDIITASGASTLVTVPPANITAAKAAVATFEGAATPAAREAAVRPMRQALQGIMSFFQVAANADPADAEVIIESGGFKVKKITPRQKQDFELSNGINSGTVNLEAPGGVNYACHDWMYSADGISFIHLPPTMSAHTHMDGLTVGQWAYFTHEVVTKDGGQGVSQIEKIMVK